MTRPKNGTLQILGLAAGFVVLLFAGAAAWGRTDRTLDDHERRLENVEDDVKVTRLLVVQMAALQGINVKE